MTALQVAGGARRPAFWWGYVLWALYYGVTVFALSVGLYGASLPVWDVVPMFQAFLFCMAICVIWAFGFVVAVSRAQVRMSNWSLTRWLGIPVLGLTCLALILSGLPAAARFDLSRASLERVAVEVEAGGQVAPGWIGLERIDAISSQSDGTVVFQIPHGGYLGKCGLAYNAHNEPVHDDYQLGSELATGWWTWCEMFD